MRSTAVTLALLVFLMMLGLATSACGPAGRGSGADGEEDATTGGTVADGTGGETTADGTTEGDVGGTADVGGTTTANDQSEEWTVDPNVPDVVGGKRIHRFSGYQDAEGLRLYFCGEGGVMRVREGATWRNLDLSVSETIRDCDVANDDLMVAVGDQGRVWKWQGTENWQGFDLLIPANLRGVTIVSLGVIRVVGVAGTIQRLDTAVWTDESLPDVDSTLEDIAMTGDLSFAVGDNALLFHDGTSWSADAIPPDPPGTPAANQGFAAKAVWAAGPDAVWAVGDKAKIAFRDGTGTWQYQASNWFGLTRFNAVWGFNDSDVFCVGEVGKARRWNGTEWTVMEIKTPKYTRFQDPWPSDLVVPPEGAGLTYVGAFAKDPLNLWLFTAEGLLIRYNDDYEL